MIDAHRTQTMRSVHERETRITALAAERGFFKRIFNWFRIRALKAEIATLYKADSHYSSALDLRLCTRQTRTIRPLSIRQSHAFDHFSIRRSLLERKRNSL